MITSVHNPRIKTAAKLRDRKGRDEQQRIIIDGAREISRALVGGIALDEVFVCPALCRGEECRRALAQVAAANIEVVEVAENVFVKIAFGERGEGIVATAPTPQRTLTNLALPVQPLIAVLAGVEKPGNVGAVLRSADAAGISALIVADGGTDLFNPNAIRASLGAIFTLPVCAATSAQTLAWLREKRLAIFAARVDGAINYHQANLHQPAAIVLGSEAHGLDQTWRAPDIHGLRLPMNGVVDSLNVSATAAVLFYEARRQREISRQS